MKPNAPQWLPDHCRVTRYEFCILPEKHSAAQSMTITVEWRGEGKWAVCRQGYTLGRQKTPRWTYESSPSNRTDHYKKLNRWDTLTDALAAAEAALPALTVMGKTAQELLEGGWT